MNLRDSAAAADVEIVITPPVPQYDQLVVDLETLRAAGAASNTDAIVAAVHAAAQDCRNVASPTMRRAA